MVINHWQIINIICICTLHWVYDKEFYNKEGTMKNCQEIPDKEDYHTSDNGESSAALVLSKNFVPDYICQFPEPSLT